jgi:uncharacterized protein (DUF362 family)/Pyruvate/2-oxoacid:ferredoxin oxidoreductase delta subunit
MKKNFYVQKCTDYNLDIIIKIIEKGLENIFVDPFFLALEKKEIHDSEPLKILIKPNLLAPRRPKDAVTTHPLIFEGLIIALKNFIGKHLPSENNSPVKIYAGDSPGLGKGIKAAEKCGLLDVCRKHDIQFADFDHALDISVKKPRACSQFTVAKAAAEADIIINMPKMKTHSQTIFTGAVKNMFGIVPGTKKAAMHFRFRDINLFGAMLADLNKTFKPAISIMDAVISMEGPGPGAGTPVNTGFIAISSDQVLLDTFCCSLIGIDPLKVEVLVQAQKAGLGIFFPKQIITNEYAHLMFPGFKVPKTRYSILRVIPVWPFISDFVSGLIIKKPVINKKKCIQCNECYNICPAKPKAIEKNKKAFKVINKLCISCYCCHEVCPEKAIDLKRPLF